MTLDLEVDSTKKLITRKLECSEFMVFTTSASPGKGMVPMMYTGTRIFDVDQSDTHEIVSSVSAKEDDVQHTLWWTPRVEGDVPSPRAAHTCDVVKGDKICLFGGWNGKTAMNDLYILDPESMTWDKIICEGSPPPRNNHITCVVSHQLYVHGGHNGMNSLDDFYVLDLNSFVWSEVVTASKSPAARCCHTLTRIKNKLYMFGGYNGTQCFNNMDVFNLKSLTWSQLSISGQIPTPRHSHSITAVDSKLIMFGGHDGYEYLTDVFVFDTVSLRWTNLILQGSPPLGLKGHTAQRLNNWILIFGGSDGMKTYNELRILDMKKLSWVYPQHTKFGPSNRQRHAACIISHQYFVIIGGFDGTRWLNDIHILSIPEFKQFHKQNSSVTSLVQCLRNLLGNSQFSDVTLLVEGKAISAHKCILSTRCAFFASLFNSTYQYNEKNTIAIPGYHYSSVWITLEYIYTGDISHLHPQVLSEAIGIADNWKLDNFKHYCEMHLRNYVSSRNVCHILRQAHQYHAYDLRNFCVNYILCHSIDVLRNSVINELRDSPVSIAHLSDNLCSDISSPVQNLRSYKRLSREHLSWMPPLFSCEPVDGDIRQRNGTTRIPLE